MSIERGQKKRGDQALGRSCGGLSTKIHAVVEGLGNLSHWVLTGGNAHDSTQASTLLEAVERCGDMIDSVTADKAYDAGSILEMIEAIGAKAVIPPKSNRRQPRPFDSHHYKSRNIIERFFCRLKQFRRIATRYDKLASRFSSFIAIAAAIVWLA